MKYGGEMRRLMSIHMKTNLLTDPERPQEIPHCRWHHATYNAKYIA